MIEIKKDNDVLKVSKATYNDMFKSMGYVIVEETKTAPKAKIEEEEEELIVIPKETEKTAKIKGKSRQIKDKEEK